MDAHELTELIGDRIKAADELAETLRRIGYVKRGSEEESWDIDRIGEIAREALEKWNYVLNKTHLFNTSED